MTNNWFTFINRVKIKLLILISIAVMLDACSKPQETSIPKVAPGTIDKSRPIKIAKAYVYDGGRCILDNTPLPAGSNLITTSHKLPLYVNGLAVIDGAARPVSPMIFAVLSNEQGRYYFEGKRYPRPDFSRGNHMLDLAGFEVSGNLSNIPAGDYELSIAMGTEFVIAMCKTQVVVRVGE
jgi:hypothetical protein